MHPKTAAKILKKVKQDYDDISEEFDKSRKREWKEFKEILPYIKDGDKVLDLGCGNGRLFEFIQKNRKISYTGVDSSKKLISIAKKTYPKAKFIVGDMLSLPFKKAEFDVIISIAALHHIPSAKLRAHAIKEMERISKPGARLIVMVWNLFQPKYKKYIWKSRFKYILSFGGYDSNDTFIPWKNEAKRYYHAFKERELGKLLKDNGFEILKDKTGNNLIAICRKK